MIPMIGEPFPPTKKYSPLSWARLAILLRLARASAMETLRTFIALLLLTDCSKIVLATLAGANIALQSPRRPQEPIIEFSIQHDFQSFDRGFQTRNQLFKVGPVQD